MLSDACGRIRDSRLLLSALAESANPGDEPTVPLPLHIHHSLFEIEQ
jgi:hypothetical protein